MIPVACPDIGPLEEQYVMEAVKSGWVSSIGAFVDRFESEFASFCEVDEAIAVSNGTDALFLALKAAGIGPGDEVIVPDLTFAAVPASVVHVGAEPVLVDVHPDYWCIDPRAIERAITPKTKAIIAVHLYGHPADMDPIMELARQHDLFVIEDAAEAHGARYKGRVVGSIGDVGCFSFYGNKIITTGEGGAITSNNPDLLARIRYLKDHAMSPERRYYHTEAGYNCRMTNLQAALGCAQLQRRSKLYLLRDNILEMYRSSLSNVSGVRLNPKMDWATPVNWLVCAVVDTNPNERGVIMKALQDSGIDTRPFFVPMSLLPPYQEAKKIAITDAQIFNSNELARKGMNLPTHLRLTKTDIERIAKVIAEAIKRLQVRAIQKDKEM